MRPPIKNITPLVADIRRSDVDYGRAARGIPVYLKPVPTPPPRIWRKRRNLAWRIGAVSGATVLALLVVSFLQIRKLPAVAGERGGEFAVNIGEAFESFRDFRIADARNHLEKNNEIIRGITDAFEGGGGKQLLGALGYVAPPLGAVTELVEGVSFLNSTLLRTVSIVEDIQEEGLGLFLNDGMSLIAKLREAQATVHDLINHAQQMKSATTELKTISSAFEGLDVVLGEKYVAYTAYLYQLDEFLSGLISLVGSDVERHILVLFQNPAEIRPGGGFIGSFGDLVVRGGQMIRLDVHDIYDYDGQLELKIIPPQPLQTITTSWGARDANWFFDFPVSAKAVKTLLEASKINQEQGITYDAVFAINIRVFETILDLIGPLPLPDYDLTITKENFLAEIQREVESGDDKTAGHPKRILSELSPLVLSRLGTLDASAGATLFERLHEHMTHKDIMIVADDPALSSFAHLSNIDGSLYELPNNFWGSYVGVVNANIAGGKSDAFIAESIDVRVDVDTGGGALTDVRVTRTHSGQKEKDPWWRAPNKNFMQIFTNPGATLVNITGNETKTIISDFDYDNEGFSPYPDLERIEKTSVFLNTYKTWNMQAFEKNVFATWFTVPAGKTKELSIRYQTPDSENFLLEPGKQYAFVFDRQSGVNTALNITVFAPIGFAWAEAKGPVFSGTFENPESRIIIPLTLVK